MYIGGGVGPTALEVQIGRFYLRWCYLFGGGWKHWWQADRWGFEWCDGNGSIHTQPISGSCYRVAWLPVRAWYRHKYQWVWLKWYMPNSTGYLGDEHAVSPSEP